MKFKVIYLIICLFLFTSISKLDINYNSEEDFLIGKWKFVSFENNNISEKNIHISLNNGKNISPQFELTLPDREFTKEGEFIVHVDKKNPLVSSWKRISKYNIEICGKPFMVNNISEIKCDTLKYEILSKNKIKFRITDTKFSIFKRR